MRSYEAGQDKKLKNKRDNESGGNRKENPRKEGEVVWACDEKRGALRRKKGDGNENTVEPLTNDHPHQRPSLSYDHISCNGLWFLFVYESLTSDHPSYTTTPMCF